MPFYNDLRPEADFATRDFIRVFPNMTKPAKIRTIDGLLRLREALDKAIPSRRTEENLLAASWNIKEFGHTTQRLPESYYYIAEIVARFDLVAIQEVKSTLKDISILMRILGSDWSYLVNDITDGTSGNRERSCYLYNNKRVNLSGLVGELVLWPAVSDGAVISQLARTPYMTGFRAGWKSFVLINLHLSPDKTGNKAAARKAEVELLVKALNEKSDELWGENLILTGDFNFFREVDQQSVDLLNAAGFVEVNSLVGKLTNAALTEVYDRFFIRKNKFFRLALTADGKESGGVFNPFDHVFRLADAAVYLPEMLGVYGGAADLANDATAMKKYFDSYWQQNQLSDHLPIWFEMIIDSSSPFLAENRTKIEAEP
ncbi:MAG: endonuclease/exonuclease/phosphatase family protein [Devosia sp.]|uniref:endonuclease/exonuclease/phosphatase family protein n=1 Tax=Devosia sp. TaxID=1871048 RepID=UPI0033937F12